MKCSLSFLCTAALSYAAAIRNATSPLCALRLHDSISNHSVKRANDWTVVSWTSKTLWPGASFYLSADGQMYGGNGQTCSFSPYLTCIDDTASTNIGGFAVSQNGPLTLAGQARFWFCPDPDGDAHHAEAAPLTFPPIGFLAAEDEPDYASCNATVLTADTCFDEDDFDQNPQSLVLGNTNNQPNMTGNAGRTKSTVECIVAGLIAATLLTA